MRVAIALLVFSLTNIWASVPKKFIVKFKVHKSTLTNSGESIQQGVYDVVKANSIDEVKDRFGLLAESVEEDRILTHMSDPYAVDQWNLFNSNYGIDINNVWSLQEGDSNNVIAIVDTGILPHSDLQGKVLPGVDMVSDSIIGNDGDGRDSDPTDPGDWVSQNDPCYSGRTMDSSWHGTHVAGIAASLTGNNNSIAGIDKEAMILPVRVLGKCGGYTSDIADGIRWAAGGNVSGMPANSNPANVINLSLGGMGSCSSYMQDAINFAVSQGATVVVAAGNSSLNIEIFSFSPANCKNVITVGATNSFGAKTNYSNYGNNVHIWAPGGEGFQSIFSLGDNGTTFAQNESTVQKSGTSMAAPHIAGIASLMLAQQPGLAFQQIKQILTSTAANQSFGKFVDAYASVQQAASTIPTNPVLEEGSPVSGTAPIFTQISGDDDSGGGCGSVDMSGGSGPRGGMTILLGFLVSLLVNRFRYRFR